MMHQRNYSIDTIKGFLILCVVIGHVLLGTLDENIVRWVIFMFFCFYVEYGHQVIQDIC